MNQPDSFRSYVTMPPDYETKLLVVCAIVIIASVSRMVSLLWRLPKIAVSMACGLLLGLLVGPDVAGQGAEASSIPVYASMYVPAVTYTVTIQMPYHVLCSCAVTCLTLGTAGLLLSALLNGLALYTVRIIDVPMRELFFSSLLISYQEPMVITDVITPSPCVATWFLWFVLGSLVLGKAVGHAMAYMLDHLHYEATLMCSLSLASVYITYYLADLFMFRGGMLGVIAMGLTMKSCATSTAMTDDEPFLRFWSTYRYVLCVLLTFLASMRVGRDLMHIRNYGRPVYMPTVYCMIRLSNRVITVVVLFPVLRRTGYQLSARQAMVLAWVTLKGPVTMVALSTKAVGTFTYMPFVVERFTRVLAVIESCLIPAFTVTPLMRFLGMLQLDAPESARVRRSMKSIWGAAARSRERQRSQRNFSGADWKWIEEHIYLADSLSLGYRLEKAESHEPLQPAKKKTERNMSSRLNRMTKVMFKDEFTTERQCSSVCVIPGRGIAKAYMEVNRNIRTLQTVSLRRQFENGMIHPETYAKILTAVQTKVKDDSFLDLETMKKLLYLPNWMFAFKDKVLSALPESSDNSSWSTSGWGSELLSPGHVVTNRLRRAQTCILFNALAALSLAALLAGILVADLEHPSPLFTTASVAVQGCIVLLHSVELIAMYARSPTATFLAVDTSARLDLVAYLLQLGLFCVSAWCSAFDVPLQECWLPVALFVALAACRTHKFWVHRRLISEAWLRWMDQAINQRVFRMYDMAVAFINSEEEVIKSVASAKVTGQVTVFMRDEANSNKLELLKEIISIQQRYPQLECVARSRLIARRILNSCLSALSDLEQSGLVEQDHYTELVTRLEKLIRDLNRLPSSVSVPETTVSFLLSVPWLPAESVPRLKKLYCWKYNKGMQLVSSGKKHQAIHIVFSGIVKIEGTHQTAPQRLPALANADSMQYFSSEDSFTDFLVAPGSLGILGFLNKTNSVCDVICETDIEACVIPMSLMDKLVSRDASSPCILYRMWQWVAVRIALDLLQGREEFEGVDPDALRRYVEDGRLPYLGRVRSFVLEEDVDCAVLVQGTMSSTLDKGRREFLGPQFVPENVRCLDVKGNPATRPLPVLLLLCKHRYRLPTELDWQNMPGEMFSAEPEYRTRTISRRGRRLSSRSGTARRR
ncbi:sperm-specific sodium:proton exchanger-like isoform X2 [Dermacentor albipictus]|uniref:sperm-specific sodium:proton exchanger-like isoform X2 n=1 Tax=Dermacentor albipictus TaxID=60249 RepID=UPI0038FCC27F